MESAIQLLQGWITNQHGRKMAAWRRPPHGRRKAEGSSKSWQCMLCAFAYNEAAGLPEEGIAPGTRWEDVPADWTCPDCAADKSGFERIAS
jgi:rubredoxin